MFPLLLAQASLNSVLEAGLQDAQKVAAAWDNNWQLVFGGGSAGGATLFSALNDLGLLFAIGSLAISGIGFYRALSQQRAIDYATFFWSILGISLFAQGGALLANSILALRSIVNQVSDLIVASTLAGVRIDEVLQEVQGGFILRGMLENAYKPCLSMSGQEQAACLQEAAAFSQNLKSLFDTSFGPLAWLGDIFSRFQDAGSALLNGDSFSLVGTFSPLWQPIVYSILYWMMQGYQHLIEAVLILTGLMAPLAVGGSMFLFGVNALVGWLTGFFAISIAKIAFNVLVGLAAVTVTNAGTNDPGWFPLFVGLFAPLFSFAVASGSGFAVWTAFTSISASGARLGAGMMGGPAAAGAAGIATRRQ